jgi:NADH-quinone oxidoreductase subunit F
MAPPFLLPPEPVTSVAQYLAAGGGLGLARAVDLGPEQTVKEVTLARLRGRGGAGFPTGRKWSTIASAGGTHHYVVVNGAEGEPATFKDRALLRANPYQVVEGAMIAAFAVGAAEVFMAVKERFTAERDNLVRAVEELQREGFGGDVTVNVVTGPDDYLFGEEKALLEVIEGHAALPRVLPPYEHGLFATAPQVGWESHSAEPGHRAASHQSNPTLVNNVETMANVPHILRLGAEWFRSMGTDRSPGQVVVTVVGDVQRPGVAEVELGTPMATVLDVVGGGVAGGRSVKAVLSGVANPVLTADGLSTPMTYDDLAAAGAGLGAAGFVVYDDTACMVEVARLVSWFLSVESCGQCPPCKLGSQAITEGLTRIEAGTGDDHDVDVIGSWLERVTDANRCYLGTQEQLVVSSLLRSFPEEFAAHLEGRGCPRPRSLPLPKLVDLDASGPVYAPA